MVDGVFQNVIDQIKKVIDREVGVVNENGHVIASSGENQSNIYDNCKSEFKDAINDDTFQHNDYTYRLINSDTTVKQYAFSEGTDEESKLCVAMLAVSLRNIKEYYDDKYDKNNFVKNIILENILSGDIYIKAREMKLSTDVNRVCMLIRTTNKTEVSTYSIVQNLFPDKDKDFIVSINENDIVLVKEVPFSVDNSDLENLAASISDTLSSEFYTHSVIGIGTKVEELKDMSRSYKESQVALEVAKVFDNDKNIVSYENLGIARLVYQLPTTLCEMFLKEVFKKGSIESLDQEILFTIKKFFENNLNVSETSRKLFVHRNTLVYRLEKIKKITGLDLREFEDAIVFKIALMVKKYLDTRPIKY